MRLSVPFSDLATLVRSMGATPVDWVSRAGRLENINIAEILLAGIEIPIEEVEHTEDGLLTYKGEQVLLYIKDTMKDKNTLLYDVNNAPRFHVAECRTLERMRSQKRYDRYVVTNNTSGEFNVEYFEWATNIRGETLSRLKVCKDCLSHLNYNGYSRHGNDHKQKIWNAFSIVEFFEVYRSRFIKKPAYTDKTAPKGGYSDDWSAISNEFRHSIGWKCQKCGVDLSGKGSHHLLHVHHINGVKGDNNRRNLQALCSLCHVDQPQHGHMRVQAEDQAKILTLRREQKLRMARHSAPSSGGDDGMQYRSLAVSNPRTLTPPNMLVTQSQGTDQKVPSKKSSDKLGNPVAKCAMDKEQVRKELIRLRSQIWKDMPYIEHAHGILRKNMLFYFLNDRIVSDEEFHRRIPDYERQKTDRRQLCYLNEIFDIIRLMK